MKGRKSHLIKQESNKKDVKKVKFPQDLVFDEIVKEGDSSEIVSFLRRTSVDVDVNKRNKDGSTALEDLIKNSNLKCVRVMIGLGADVNRADEEGQTPLHYASRYGDFNVAKLLLESNADPNMVDNRGLLPIDYTDNFELIELLVSHSNLSAGQDETFHTFRSGDETSH